MATRFDPQLIRDVNRARDAYVDGRITRTVFVDAVLFAFDSYPPEENANA